MFVKKKERARKRKTNKYSASKKRKKKKKKRVLFLFTMKFQYPSAGQRSVRDPVTNVAFLNLALLVVVSTLYCPIIAQCVSVCME